MDRIEKLFRKISKKDRLWLLDVIERLTAGLHKGLNIKKIKKTSFYRLRAGRFRIIFHHGERTKELIVDSVKLRDKDTYKGL